MIGRSLTILNDQLAAYLADRPAWNPQGRASFNVNTLNTGMLDWNNIADNQEGIAISLINIELESTLRNYSNNRVTSNGVAYSLPSIYMNLYILFSCIAKEINYDKSLIWLSHTISFFQANNCFSYANTTGSNIWNVDSDNGIWEKISLEQRNAFKLILTPHPLKLDQTNQLWSTLGGKQVPHIVYKGKLVQLRDNQLRGTGSVITDINSTEIIN